MSLRNRTRHKEEDGKRLVFGKGDRAITCMFYRDLYPGHHCFLVLYKKICLKEGEVWRKVFSNKIIVMQISELRGFFLQ